MPKLIIVESPTKVKSISKYLGSDYLVMASVGHIRDLPPTKDIPADLKKKYTPYSIDIEGGFIPYYAITKGVRGQSKTKVVSELKKALKSADELLLATDPDREGEAIAWHLNEVLKPSVPTKRMVFNEVTKESVQNALNNLRDIDLNLVDAQETRRIVDRLFGYRISPILWRRISKGLSAGRVQSPALKLIVEREIERSKFIKANYMSIEAQFSDGLIANLKTIDDSKVATSDSFNDLGEAKKDVIIIDNDYYQSIEDDLNNAEYKVESITSSPYKRSPKPPFTTSTLQQSAGNILGFSASQTMQIAQKLYEQGFITYMRTDSNHLSDEGLQGSKKAVVENYGEAEFQSRQYATKSKNAQESHEAIRPAGANFINPLDLPIGDEGQNKLYALIYARTLASQMKDCQGLTTTINITGKNSKVYQFSASGTVITEPGFRKAYHFSEDDSKILPEVKENEKLSLEKILPEEHSTKPPARYTEASLVRKLEELGIGRPSTYASIINTIIQRGYVWKKGSALVPAWLAFSTIKLLNDKFSDLVDYNYTAQMEEDLDEISNGEKKRLDFLNHFYFGDTAQNHQGLEKLSDEEILDTIDTKETNTMFTPNSNRYQLRIGSYGASVEDLEGTPDEKGNFPRAFVPQEMTLEELTEDIVKKLIEENAVKNPASYDFGKVPDTDFEIVGALGPYGEYLKVETGKTKKNSKTGEVEKVYKNVGLIKGQKLEELSRDDVLKLIQLPRVLGTDPNDEQEIIANNGMFGPYLQKGKKTTTSKPDYRSLKDDENSTAIDKLFNITLDEAIEIYKQPKVFRRGRRSS